MSNPNTIQGGRWDEYLRRKFNLKGGTNTPELASEIMPTVSIPFGLEDHFLLRERLMWGRGGLTSAAGEFPQLTLQNTNDSNTLVIIEGLYLSSIGVAVQASAVGNVSFGGTTNAQRVRDGRWGSLASNNPGVCKFREESVVAGTGVATIVLPPTFEGFFPLMVVLPPQDLSTFVVEGTVAQSNIGCTFVWREILLEPSASG